MYTLYRDLQNNIKDPVRISQENTHSAPQIQHHKNQITNNLGWRTAKGNYGLHEGAWYLEVTLKSGNARVGFAQISADLQAYPGFDSFGYGYDNEGGLFHQAISRKTITSKPGFKAGDVVGMLIRLPSDYSPEEIDILESRKWDPSILYAPISVNEKEVEIWRKESNITYFVNGSLIIGFPMLFLGRYYPAIGLWNNAVVEVNCGPKFKYSLPNGAKPYNAAISAPICIGQPYDAEEIRKLQQERQIAEAQAASNAKKINEDNDMSSDEKLLKKGENLIASPVADSGAVMRSPANRLKRKGISIDVQTTPTRSTNKTPDLKTQSAGYILSPLRPSPRSVRAPLPILDLNKTFSDDTSLANVAELMQRPFIPPVVKQDTHDRKASAESNQSSSMAIGSILNSEHDEFQ